MWLLYLLAIGMVIVFVPVIVLGSVFLTVVKGVELGGRAGRALWSNRRDVVGFCAFWTVLWLVGGMMLTISRSRGY